MISTSPIKFLAALALLIPAILFSITQVSLAQSKGITKKYIIDKHADAIGLTHRIRVRTLLSFGKINQLGTELEVTILQKRPNLYRLDVHVEDGRITQAYDGSKGWALNPFISNDTIPITGLELDQLAESAIFDGILLNASDLNYSVEYIGEDDIITTPCYVLLLKKPNGDRLKFFIDKVDFLIKRTEASLFFEGMTYEVNSVFSDFRIVNGMTLPFVIENNNGQLSTTIRIESVKVNETLENGLFTGRRKSNQ